MNILKCFWFSLLFIVVFSCSNKKKEKKELLGQSKSSIFNLNTLLTEDENDVSFPIWFTDSIIKAHKIKKITRKSFKLDREVQNPLKSIHGAVPREMREYYFNQFGAIIQLNVHYYYDDREIGSILFSYTGEKDAYGYSQVKRKTIVTKTAKRISETHEFFDPEVRELDFKMHVKRKGAKKYLAYQDMETGDFSYFLLNSNYWGTLSVDSILKPDPKDIIGWGTPLFPSKKYQVSNKVKEQNVKMFIYDKQSGKFPDYWLKKVYPFDYKRSFIYNRKGICNGYIDSTFADEVFVTRMISNFHLNKKGEPIRIVHQKENASNDKEYFSIETYTYE
ncbi:MAG: hypothetical protein LW701_00960 [Fluviicola sp.]|nr:hypothetical protein [Fluviicola sp.]